MPLVEIMSKEKSPTTLKTMFRVPEGGIPFVPGGRGGNVRFVHASSSGNPFASDGIPFGIPFGMPGMGNPLGGLPSAPPGTHTELYDRLELGHEASQEEISSAYKRLRILRHPDKPTGSTKLFQDLQYAYSVLSHPEKRKIYDEYGPKGIEMAAQTDAAPHVPRRRVPPIHVEVELDLEELFRPQEKRVRYDRIMAEGARRSRVQMSETVHIPKGVLDGYRTTLSEKGHVDGSETGDVIVQVSYLPHDVFKPEGFELIIQRDVSLRLALLGGKLMVPMFSDTGHVTEVPITVPPRLILQKPLISVPNGGLPLGSQSQRGHLVIACEVDISSLASTVFSHQLTRLLAEELPVHDGEMDRGSPSELLSTSAMAEAFDKSQAEGRVRWAHEFFGTDDDEEHGPQVVQCAQQ